MNENFKNEKLKVKDTKNEINFKEMFKKRTARTRCGRKNTSQQFTAFSYSPN